MSTLIEAELKVKVLKWTEKLCRALEQDYKNYALRTCMDNQEKFSSEYMKIITEQYKKLASKVFFIDISGGEPLLQYDVINFIEEGRKYYKDCMLWRGTQDDVSVQCFVDRSNGDVYKAAGWKKPAKYVRFRMSDDNDRARLYNICEWAGGHLYMR